MTNLIVETSKYLMILLAACYTLFNFRYFSFKDEERRQIMCARQNQAMFLNHLLAYLIIYLKTEDLRVVAFYLAQVVFFSGLHLPVPAVLPECIPPSGK